MHLLRVKSLALSTSNDGTRSYLNFKPLKSLQVDHKNPWLLGEITEVVKILSRLTNSLYDVTGAARLCLLGDISSNTASCACKSAGLRRRFDKVLSYSSRNGFNLLTSSYRTIQKSLAATLSEALESRLSRPIALGQSAVLYQRFYQSDFSSGLAVYLGWNPGITGVSTSQCLFKLVVKSTLSQAKRFVERQPSTILRWKVRFSEGKVGLLNVYNTHTMYYM